MAEQASVEWGQLTAEARTVLGWAAAVEVGGTVGTRGLLIGAIEAGGPDGEPEQLLRHYGVAKKDLYESLADVRLQVPIDTHPARPVSLDVLPPLTDNARDALQQAGSLAGRTGDGRGIAPTHILGGVLRVPRSKACQALQDLLNRTGAQVRLTDVATTYEAYLDESGTSSYQEFLKVRVPDPPDQAPPPATSNPLAYSRSVDWVIREAADLLGGSTAVVPGADRAAVLLCALRWAADGQSITVASELLRAVSRGVAERGRRLDAATTALTAEDVSSSGAVGGGVAAVVAEADRLRRLAGEDAVHQRHLLAAAVSSVPPTVPDRVLESLGVTLSDLRSRLRVAIAQYLPGDSTDVWDRILAEAPDGFDLLGGYSEDMVDPNKGIDRSRDHLGVGTYVAMLAALIADKETPEPLSIGLFGAWGSGKSYFMGLLRGEIKRLSGRGDRYYNEIRQIGFNAWHYSDTNIWASLGDEIFEELAGTDPASKDTQVKALREQLRTKLTSQLQRKMELESATKTAEEETARLSEALEAERAARTISLQRLAHAVTGSSTVQAKVNDAWSKLGISDQLKQGEILRDEIGGAASDLDALRLVWRGRNGTLLLLAAAVCVALVAVISLVAPSVERLVQAAGLGFSALSAAALVLLGRVRSGLTILAAAAGEINSNLEAGMNAAVKEQLAAVHAAEARQRVLRAQRDQVVDHIGELGRELAQLSPGQRMYRFVTERAGSDEYRRQLGVISTVRKDFEQLVVLLKDWREHPSNAPEGFKPVDRIVLYIDDLDRCSPRQVVDVLQAVHLLLALDLFVVVVGVDPRWLVRSLRSEYDRVLTVDPAGTSDLWQVSPQDYLEKIFNIPFSLPRMSPGSFASLLKGFLPGDADESLSSPADPSVGSEPVNPTADGPEPGSPPPGAGGILPTSLPAEEHSEVAAMEVGAPTPELRPISDAELRLLASLAPLVETPREAKRLVNLYRLIRSTRDLRLASRFLGDDARPGEYEAVVILLGLMSGHGQLLERTFTAPRTDDHPGGLIGRPGTTKWRAFVGDMKPRLVDDVWRNDVIGVIPPAEVPTWQRLHAGLIDATTLVKQRDLTAFQFWAPRIARFSFLLSPEMAGDVPGR